MPEQSITSAVYKDITNFPGYRVGDDGSVWSCRLRTGKGVYPAPWRLMKPGTSEWGHRNVQLRREGRTAARWVHRLVLEAFVGPCPEGMQCRHLDGNPSNNALANLAWGTPRDNQMDRVGHGTSNRGERHGNSKLTKNQVMMIWRLRDEGKKQHEIGAAVGVSQSCVSAIVRGLAWGWLRGDAAP